MRVLFVDPPGVAAPTNEGGSLNLAVATLTPILVRHGHQVALFDMANHRENRSIDKIARSLQTFDPDLICFSIINAQYLKAVPAIRRLREMTSKPIIVGGAEVSSTGEKIFQNTGFAVDMVVLGEGEEAIIRIAECLARGADPAGENIEGLIVNRGGVLVRTGNAQRIGDLDRFPAPDFKVFGLKRMDLYRVLGSRGCPFNCSFCFSYLGKSWRGRAPEKIVSELLEARAQYDFKMFRFYDPIFNFKRDWVRALCEAISRSALKGMPWEALGVRADRLDPDVCRCMRDAGCRRVAIGVESLHPEVFSLIKKGETIEQVKKGVKTAVEYFDEVSLFMIIGLPGDTKERSLYTYEEAKKLNPTNIAYALAVPYSGTRLEKWVNENARVLGNSYDSFTRSFYAVKGGVAYDTVEFPKEDRIETFAIVNTKEYRYVSSSKQSRYLDPVHWIKDAIRYDRPHLSRHLYAVGSQVLTVLSKKVKKAVLADRSSYEIEYNRIPDGTWWIG